MVRFLIDSLNVSNATSAATKYNNGTKLIREPGGDSLFAVYADADNAVMYAFTADGDPWDRRVLATNCSLPAIGQDSSGTRWAVMHRITQVEGTYTISAYSLVDSTWSKHHDLYSWNTATGQSCGAPSIACASDTTTGCAYAAWIYDDGEAPHLLLAKFDEDSVRIDTIVRTSGIDWPAVAAEPVTGGDYLHLVWDDGTDISYTMTDSVIAAGDWGANLIMSCKSATSLSAEATVDHPVIATDGEDLVAAWTQTGEEITDIYACTRDADTTYSAWDEAEQLSDGEKDADYAVISMGDSLVVAWDEDNSGSDYDIMGSIEFGSAFSIMNTSTESRHPHVSFQTIDSTPYIHTIWCEEPETDYYEVHYEKYEIGGSGGGGQSGGTTPFIQPRLHSCRPNPFTGRTAIRYQFPRAGNVLLRVYDVSGRTVRTLQNGHLAPGIYTAQWDGTDDRGRQVANGIYFYRFDAPGFRDVKKAVIMK